MTIHTQLFYSAGDGEDVGGWEEGGGGGGGVPICILGNKVNKHQAREKVVKKG